jgi:hypothetical protein
MDIKEKLDMLGAGETTGIKGFEVKCEIRDGTKKWAVYHRGFPEVFKATDDPDELAEYIRNNKDKLPEEV